MGNVILGINYNYRYRLITIDHQGRNPTPAQLRRYVEINQLYLEGKQLPQFAVEQGVGSFSANAAGQEDRLDANADECSAPMVTNPHL